MFRKKYSVCVIVILLAVGIIFSYKPIEPKVKLGFISPLTGWGAYWGVPEEKGIRLAIDDIKKQYGSAVDFVIEDSKTTSSDAVTAANKLFSVDNVDMVYVSFTGPSAGISSIVKENKKIMVYNALPSSLLEQNEYSFKMYFDAYEVCKLLTDKALEDGKKSISVLLLKLDFSPPCEKAITESTKAKNVSVDFYSVDYTETDFRTILLKMKDKKTDAVIGYLYEDNSLAFLKQMKELGLNMSIYCGGRHDCLTNKIVKEIGDISEAMTVDLRVSSSFESKFRKIYPNATDTDIQAAALAYDAVFFMFLSKKDCKNLECELQKMKSGLTKLFNPAVISTGFGEDRTQDIISKMYRFNGTGFVEI